MSPRGLTLRELFWMAKGNADMNGYGEQKPERIPYDPRALTM